VRPHIARQRIFDEFECFFLLSKRVERERFEGFRVRMLAVFPKDLVRSLDRC
jgi:hypothetical protein